ncbi:hypothetical protein [Pseudarthrobacter sp. AB1]|uniref:hypothetical protein n=1 Tax=Pseudarthrobacter sp. AB1 TaxID=2138309 RepID=UPI00186B67A0|nr:hypothetical protein [Pseudarthrobacter sp. AB1]MBE4720119.1 hypothetical protein [Pseudarthrobacter sp. AB1]
MNRSVTRTIGALNGLSQSPYPTQYLALRALESIRSRGKDGKQPARAYPCQECHHWHLTSKKLTGKVPVWERRLSLPGTGLIPPDRQART